MNRAHGAEITIDRLNKELESLKKKIFTYETLNSEKEIKNISGSFKSGKEVINHVKS